MTPIVRTPTTPRPGGTPLRRGRDDLRAMKRALARAPLGPKATLALTHAIIALEDELAPESEAARPRPTTPHGA
jgi:hypothetical protein